MPLVSFEAVAPSNIALVKYMGKSDRFKNRAANASLSLTLPHLFTTVSIESTVHHKDSWKSFDPAFHLTDEGLRKFLAHWERCKNLLAPDFQESVSIHSGNNFPSDCGLASSASSFAALTLAAYGYLQRRGATNRSWSIEELAQVSRQGSGSSCRSLMGPWVYWSEETVRPLTSIWKSLRHAVVIVNDSVKSVSSSEAHERVLSSALFEGRPVRADRRVQQMQDLMRQGTEWRTLFELCWAEFWDMHVLFETCQPPFYYMTPDSLRVLRYFQEGWQSQGDGPLVTMDAGPNIHLIYRADQDEIHGIQTQYLSSLGMKVFGGLC